MADDTLTFTFPMPDRMLYANGRAHWAVKSKVKNALWATCDRLVLGEVLPDPPKAPWTKATVRSVMTVGAMHDDDNAMNRHKPILDWLVTRGYVVDDKRKHLQWEGLPTQRVSRKNAPSIELTLTRVA